MYFRFAAFYKRDTTFVFSEEKNQMKLFELRTGKTLSNKLLEFEVDKIDNYINSYDLLPTFDAPLVSARFKKTFEDLVHDLQFVNALITDKKNNHNDNFYYMNILNVLPIMDKNRSVFEEEKYGNATYIDVEKLYVLEGSLKEHSIVRMKEDDSYIIITEEFKKRCDDAKLKGTHFREEGYSIYS